jgi:uncharacterized protein YidB (DUF937 family)
MAQSGEEGTGIAFLDRVAENLGVDRDTLDTAIEDARTAELDEAVANGDLTQDEADRLKERLDDLPADAPFIGPGFGHKFPGGEFGFGSAFREDGGFGFAFKFGVNGHGGGVDSESLAAFLAIDATQLGEELRADGATLATVAEAHGKSRDDLKAFISGEFQAKLDAAVAAGELTQEQADEMLASFNEHADEIIDNEFAGGPFGRGLKGDLGFAMPFGPHGIGLVAEDVAEFLGIDEGQLFDELRAEGATLAAVAEAHGKSRDELKTLLTSSVSKKLDAMVAEGMIEQARADEILSNFNERLDTLIDGEFPGFRGHFRGPPVPFGDEMFEEQMEIEPGDGTQDGELTPASRS